MKLFFVMLTFLTSTMAIAESSNFYALDCTEAVKQLPPMEPKAMYKEFNLKDDGGAEILATLATNGFYAAFINDVFYVVSPEVTYLKNQDPSKAMAFPFACTFLSFYISDLGNAAMKQKFEANFQLPKDYKLINP